MEPDYLILGSGLSALSFGALMAKAGRRVRILEAHYHPGGYGHTFTPDQKNHRWNFNAQLHYVWNCGEGQPVNRLLKKLGLEREVTFEEYDSNGYDRMRMPGFSLDIPYNYDELIDRLSRSFPKSRRNIRDFITEVKNVGEGIAALPTIHNLYTMIQRPTKINKYFYLLKHLNSTLQDVFDHHNLPIEAQTLIALQWPDFLTPPKNLSFLAWTGLFSGYSNGAYYPTKHFEHVINSLTDLIKRNKGEILYDRRVIDFILEGNKVRGVKTKNIENERNTGFYPDTNNENGIEEYLGKNIVSNIDPKRTVEMIGSDIFSKKVLRKLDYDYSPSNFMAYLVVEGIDLRNYGFGKSNLFHTEEPDLNNVFNKMYNIADYSKPSFAMTVPTLLTKERGDCPDNQQIVELLTVANYKYFKTLEQTSTVDYIDKKREILDSLLNIIERDYVPNIREKIVLKITGTPSTNERFCSSPHGNSYGSDLTPRNFGPNRLNHETSLKNLYFCNASSGYPGFAGSIGTGVRLYEILSGDKISD